MRYLITLLICMWSSSVLAFAQVMVGGCGVAQSAGPTPIFTETWNGTTEDNTWTFGGTYDNDCTTSPCPIDGDQSLSMAYGATAFINIGFSTVASVDFLFRVSAVGNSADMVFSEFQTTGSVFLDRLYVTSLDKIRVRHGSESVTSSGSVSVDTTYHIWWDYTPATSGNNGVSNVYITEYTGAETKPASPFVTISTGSSTVTAGRFYISHGTSDTGGTVYFDTINAWE